MIERCVLVKHWYIQLYYNVNISSIIRGVLECCNFLKITQNSIKIVNGNHSFKLKKYAKSIINLSNSCNDVQKQLLLKDCMISLSYNLSSNQKAVRVLSLPEQGYMCQQWRQLHLYLQRWVRGPHLWHQHQQL